MAQKKLVCKKIKMYLRRVYFSASILTEGEWPQKPSIFAVTEETKSKREFHVDITSVFKPEFRNPTEDLFAVIRDTMPDYITIEQIIPDGLTIKDAFWRISKESASSWLNEVRDRMGAHSF